MIDTTPETSWEPRYNPLNMIYLPSSLFASTQYQANPVPIRISGVYEYHADFFRALRDVPDLVSESLLFMQFMEELFTLKVKVRGKLAGQFGDMILNVDIPTTKIFFSSGLLPRQTFAGEKEFLVIGGNYLTDIAWF